MPPKRLEYTRTGPWAAKRVRRRSRGYVDVVDTVPAKAPERKEIDVEPRGMELFSAERNWEVVR